MIWLHIYIYICAFSSEFEWNLNSKCICCNEKNKKSIRNLHAFHTDLFSREFQPLKSKIDETDPQQFKYIGKCAMRTEAKKKVKYAVNRWVVLDYILGDLTTKQIFFVALNAFSHVQA